MIVLLHPRATKPKNRRFPLSILALAAVLEGREDYLIIDGNVDPTPARTLDEIARQSPIELLAVSVMPGPQLASAIPLCREFRAKYPSVPIVWGGYFPSIYAGASLNAPYVDFCVRGQGEDTFLELLSALRSGRRFAGIPGLSYKDGFGLHVHNAERPLRSPDDFPYLPYHRLANPDKYILPTFLGSRTAVHQASIGCPFRCNFCGVVPVFQGREKAESPERTASVLAHLQSTYGVNAIQFYDNNFFLSEAHTVALAERLVPLKLRWWTEGRIDAVLRYSDSTFRLLARAGATMLFFGAESGSRRALEQMNKHLTPDQTLSLAERLRGAGIVPEFSFLLGNPSEPETETRETIAFIRRIKRINPSAEIIVQHYIPTPQPTGMYGHVEDKIQFPTTPEGWVTERWLNFTIRHHPELPWLPPRIRRLIDNFELVVNSRFPTMQDIYLPRWGRALLQTLGSWRYATGVYAFPIELQWAQRFVALRKPRWESL
jgi:anaerobic magnesium-protoporphyrin IX monomethyl ester cyclase